MRWDKKIILRICNWTWKAIVYFSMIVVSETMSYLLAVGTQCHGITRIYLASARSEVYRVIWQSSSLEAGVGLSQVKVGWKNSLSESVHLRNYIFWPRPYCPGKWIAVWHHFISLLLTDYEPQLDGSAWYWLSQDSQESAIVADTRQHRLSIAWNLQLIVVSNSNR